MMMRLGSVLLVCIALLGGCFEDKKTGPVEVHWDRDACELCKMIISDPRFAAQVRGPDGKPHKFDDIGNALYWLKAMPFANDPSIEIWVADSRNMEKAEWMNARTAWYVDGQITPMDYGFGAVPEKVEGAVDFEAMRAAIYAKGNKYHCDPAAYGYGPSDEKADGK